MDYRLALIQRYFPKSEHKRAWNVMMGESGGRADAVGDNYPIRGQTIPSYGLMQIRALPGRPSPEQLKDPDFNMKYAAGMWKAQGWRPWTVARNLGYTGTATASSEKRATGTKMNDKKWSEIQAKIMSYAKSKGWNDEKTTTAIDAVARKYNISTGVTKPEDITDPSERAAAEEMLGDRPETAETILSEEGALESLRKDIKEYDNSETLFRRYGAELPSRVISNEYEKFHEDKWGELGESEETRQLWMEGETPGLEDDEVDDLKAAIADAGSREKAIAEMKDAEGDLIKRGIPPSIIREWIDEEYPESVGIGKWFKKGKEFIKEDVRKQTQPAEPGGGFMDKILRARIYG